MDWQLAFSGVAALSAATAVVTGTSAAYRARLRANLAADLGILKDLSRGRERRPLEMTVDRRVARLAYSIVKRERLWLRRALPWAAVSCVGLALSQEVFRSAVHAQETFDKKGTLVDVGLRTQQEVDVDRALSSALTETGGALVVGFFLLLVIYWLSEWDPSAGAAPQLVRWTRRTLTRHFGYREILRWDPLRYQRPSWLQRVRTSRRRERVMREWLRACQSFDDDAEFLNEPS